MLQSTFSHEAIIEKITKLLVKLIANGLVNSNENSKDDDLFYTTFDMLAVILWSYKGGDFPDLLFGDNQIVNRRLKGSGNGTGKGMISNFQLSRNCATARLTSSA